MPAVCSNCCCCCHRRQLHSIPSNLTAPGRAGGRHRRRRRTERRRAGGGGGGGVRHRGAHLGGPAPGSWPESPPPTPQGRERNACYTFNCANGSTFGFVSITPGAFCTRTIRCSHCGHCSHCSHCGHCNHCSHRIHVRGIHFRRPVLTFQSGAGGGWGDGRCWAGCCRPGCCGGCWR